MRYRMRLTRGFAASSIGLALVMGAHQAEAKGCVKGAVVGAVAGHVAGHHAMLGAAVGCAAGHHLAKEKGQAEKQPQAPVSQAPRS